MKELDFSQDQKIKVKYGSQSYEVKYPSVKEVILYRDSVEKSPGKESEIFLDFLSQLGLPKEVSESLSMRHVTALAEALMETKKN